MYTGLTNIDCVHRALEFMKPFPLLGQSSLPASIGARMAVFSVSLVALLFRAPVHLQNSVLASETLRP